MARDERRETRVDRTIARYNTDITREGGSLFNGC